MFGLFNKKKEEIAESTLHPEYLTLVDKWESFLAKIEARFEDLLHDAEDAVIDNLTETDYDLLSTMQVWSGVKSQLQELESKVEVTFDEKVSEQMLEYIDEGDLIDQDQKGVILNDSMRDRLELFEIHLEGKVGQLFYDHAIPLVSKEIKCTQCNANLEVKEDFFRSHYVGCHYCETVNTFTPNTKITEIPTVVENIVKLKCLEERNAKKEALKKCKDFRSLDEDEDKSDLKKAYEDWEVKEKAYWTKFYTEVSQYIPERKDSIDHDVNLKMKLYFYDDRMTSDLQY